VALLGGGSGREIAATLAAESLGSGAKWPTRLFVAVHDRSDGRNLLLNERGPPRDGVEPKGLLAAAVSAIEGHAPGPTLNSRRSGADPTLNLGWDGARPMDGTGAVLPVSVQGMDRDWRIAGVDRIP
jgi:hypothetical protein